MSADRGIYILRTIRNTVEENGWVEKCDPYPVWRVAYTHAIDNFYFYQKEHPYNLGAYMLDVWGQSPVFTDKDQALSFAERVLKKVKHDEYGITFLDTDYHFYTDA